MTPLKIGGIMSSIPVGVSQPKIDGWESGHSKCIKAVKLIGCKTYSCSPSARAYFPFLLSGFRRNDSVDLLLNLVESSSIRCIIQGIQCEKSVFCVCFEMIVGVLNRRFIHKP
jgi:hypothetical protein